MLCFGVTSELSITLNISEVKKHELERNIPKIPEKRQIPQPKHECSNRWKNSKSERTDG